MGYIRGVDYEQVHMFPPTLEEFVSATHPARFIRDFVEVVMEHDGRLIEWGDGEKGRPPYPPEVLARVWMYGYYTGIRSTRKLEEACKVRTDFMWLTGMLAPDHNSLWRFFKTNRKFLRQFFKNTVRAAAKADYLGFVLHALDGTRIPSQSATRSGWHKEDLEKALVRLDERMVTLEEEISSAGPGVTASDDSLPEKLEDIKNRREKVREAFDYLQSQGLTHLHPQEPDARIMQCKDRGKKLFGYNAQAISDEKSGLIVAENVVNQENDLQQLTPMLELARDNLGKLPELTVADKGYCSGTACKEALDKGFPVCVHLLKHYEDKDGTNPYHASHFTYDEETDTCVCPRGERLTYEKDRHRKPRGYTARIYRCHCQECPVREQCTKESRGRTVEIAPHNFALREQGKLQRTEKGKEALKKRKHIIETVFGQIKENQRFRRWSFRDLDAVQTQWSLMCAGYNLRKLHAFWVGQEPTLALKMA